MTGTRLEVLSDPPCDPDGRLIEVRARRRPPIGVVLGAGIPIGMMLGTAGAALVHDGNGHAADTPVYHIDVTAFTTFAVMTLVGGPLLIYTLGGFWHTVYRD